MPSQSNSTNLITNLVSLKLEVPTKHKAFGLVWFSFMTYQPLLVNVAFLLVNACNIE